LRFSRRVDQGSSFVGKVSKAFPAPTPWLGKVNNIMIWCNSREWTAASS
jgi:hypothetical protein